MERVRRARLAVVEPRTLEVYHAGDDGQMIRVSRDHVRHRFSLSDNVKLLHSGFERLKLCKKLSSYTVSDRVYVCVDGSVYALQPRDNGKIRVTTLEE